MLLFSRIPFPVILFILSSLPFLPFTISYPLSCLLLSSLRLSYYPPLSSLPSLILFLVSPHFPYYLISYLILSLISSYPLFVHPLLPSFLSATTTGHGRIVTDRMQFLPPSTTRLPPLYSLVYFNHAPVEAVWGHAGVVD